mgnify:CR=1 FL=1
MSQQPSVIVVHGGALFSKPGPNCNEYHEEFEGIYQKYISEALSVGYELIKQGGAAIDAVLEAAQVMENSGYFTAGKGSLKTSKGTHAVDASVMDGSTLKAGAVADCCVKNASSAARLVMDKTPHVMIVGAGAEQLAAENGCEVVDETYFFNPHFSKKAEHGTIGAIALDTHGNLAAVTSTGGTTNKYPHRVGDSPIIGAGTYADNKTCAVSCTGTGEFFMRTLAAFNVSARIKYAHMPLKEAAEQALQEITDMKGLGGIIAVDHEGNIAVPFNSPGMFRGYIDREGKQDIQIF